MQPFEFNIKFKINLQVIINQLKMRSKGKGKSNAQGKNQPLNINISFNINPKNILHNEIPQGIKYHQRMQSEQLPNSARFRHIKHKKGQSEFEEYVASDLTLKKGNNEGIVEGDINKKQLQKIKKKFLNRINNMDITLALPENERIVPKQQDEANQSSLMSARMEQYDSNPVKKSTESLQFNFNSISGKSKILSNNEPSKILPLQTFKKPKNESKQQNKRIINMTHSKQGKLGTHYKGFSTFTDVKYSPEKYHRKKVRGMNGELRKAKVKQQNLQQKLDRFKLDMMKLALAYDETEVLKTKLSSEYYNNIRSRQISKQVVDVQKINEVQQHEKTQEIKNYQAIQQQKQATPQMQSQSFKQLKDVYQDLTRKKNLQEAGQCTEDIVEYYTQLTSEPKCIIDDPRDNSQSEASYIHSNSSLWAQQQKAKDNQGQQDKIQSNLQQFVKYLQQKLAESPNRSEIARQLTQLLEQYSKNTSKQKDQNQQQKQQTHSQKKPVQTAVLNIDNIDRDINKELQEIPQLRDDLVDYYHMNGDQVFQLEQWQEKYKSQLLKIKGKMWKQYKTIRNVIENRINATNSNNQKQIETKMMKKQNKIMKCLSQKLLMRNQLASVSIESLQQLKNERIVLKLPKQNGFLIRQQHLVVEPSLSDDNSDSRFDLEIMNGQPGFVPTSSQFLNSQTSQKEENMLINSLVKIQMQQKENLQMPPPPTISSLHHLNEEDKQDIFQFIFLDVCIELYQEAIQKENQPNKVLTQQVNAANRILNSLKSYIQQEKQRKSDKQNRKIGFCTNVNSVKQTVQQICQFILGDTKANDSQHSNRERMLKKLATPLGPSQTQILKSLRLSLFNNQPVDDYGDEVEEADLLVLEPDLFLTFENEVVKIQQLSFPKYYDDEKRDQMRISFLRNCTHIHQKAIFDCLNENLDYHRNFGIWGKPFLWKKTSIFQHQLTEKDLKNALTKSGAEVVKCAAFVCGLMVQKEDSLIKDIASDSSYVRRLQDERIYKLLENFVIEMEEKWFFHDDQEAEILVELSHIVWTILIKQALKEFQSLLK